VPVDLKTGTLETVIRLPGFARWLDFVGPYAFVGLSKLRATNAQLEIVLTDENPDRSHGKASEAI